MVKKKKMKVAFAAFAGVMFLGGLAFSPNKSQAAKKVSITKSLKVNQWTSKKIKLSNNKKKVTWSVIKGKEIVSLVKKSKTGVYVNAWDAGTAKIQAKIGSKKYVCTVKIKAVKDEDAKKGILTEFNYSYWGVKKSGAVVIPEGVKTISQNAFFNANTSKITSIKLPNSLKCIEDYAFKGMALKSIEIPDTVNELGENAFYSCTQLKSIKLSSGLKKLSKNLFDGCTQLTDVTIPDSVTTIESECFYECYGLKSIKLPNTLKELGGGAFFDCKNLTDITIPDGVTTIGSDCFYCCGISTITVPDSVTNISGNPFDSDMKITWKGTTYEDSYDFMKAFNGQS